MTLLRVTFERDCVKAAAGNIGVLEWWSNVFYIFPILHHSRPLPGKFLHVGVLEGYRLH